jgi:ABC-type bacteriocin/lantibiotic exporter with double-glycine peptidase domain
MVLQSGPHDCGAAAVVNALLALGTRVTAARVRRDAGTTVENGTTEHGIKQALERAGAKFQEISTGLDNAYALLHGHLTAGGSAIVLTEQGGHWETAVGVLGDRILFFNPDKTPENRAESGIHVISGRQLRRYWTPFEGKRYAILVSK